MSAENLLLAVLSEDIRLATLSPTASVLSLKGETKENGLRRTSPKGEDKKKMFRRTPSQGVLLFCPALEGRGTAIAVDGWQSWKYRQLLFSTARVLAKFKQCVIKFFLDSRL